MVFRPRRHEPVEGRKGTAGDVRAIELPEMTGRPAVLGRWPLPTNAIDDVLEPEPGGPMRVLAHVKGTRCPQLSRDICQQAGPIGKHLAFPPIIAHLFTPLGRTRPLEHNRPRDDATIDDSRAGEARESPPWQVDVVADGRPLPLEERSCLVVQGTPDKWRERDVIKRVKLGIAVHH